MSNSYVPCLERRLDLDGRQRRSVPAMLHAVVRLVELGDHFLGRRSTRRSVRTRSLIEGRLADKTQIEQRESASRQHPAHT